MGQVHQSLELEGVLDDPVRVLDDAGEVALVGLDHARNCQLPFVWKKIRKKQMVFNF